MTAARPTLLLTRPEAASRAFLDACRARLGADVPAVISPILSIVDHGPLPDMAGYRTVILTSGHAVARLGAAGVLNGRQVATVGEGTAEVARRYGAAAEALGPDVAGFLNHAARLDAPCLHCRGAHSRGDLAQVLSDRGVRTDEAVIYDQVAQTLSQDALHVLTGGTPVVCPVFSPRSAALLSAEVPSRSDVTIIAISPAARDAWAGPGVVHLALAPNAEAMLDAIAKAF